MSTEANPTPLPFSLDIPSYASWLEGLPLNNIGECSRVFVPVLQWLGNEDIPPRLRFALLEKSLPTVQGMVRKLSSLFLGKSLPLESKPRTAVGIAKGLHFGAAQAYRMLAENQGFTEQFSADERGWILHRAFAHLAFCQLLTAQGYATPPQEFWSSLSLLFKQARQQRLLNVPLGNQGSPLGWFRRILLFHLAAPNRLSQRDMQRLFNLLARHIDDQDSGPATLDPMMRVIFEFQPADPRAITPHPASQITSPDWRILQTDRMIPALRRTLAEFHDSELAPLMRILHRFGDRLEFTETAGGRRTRLIVGFESIVAGLRMIDARRGEPKDAQESPMLNQMDLLPNENGLLSPRTAPRETVDWGSGKSPKRLFDSKRTCEVHHSHTPGFFLVESRSDPLQCGELVGLNTDDHAIQVGVIRGGQMYGGRFWHCFELLGDVPRLVRVRRSENDKEIGDGLWVSNVSGSGLSDGVVLQSSYWHPGDDLDIHSPSGWHSVCVSRLLETTHAFTNLALSDLSPAEDGIHSGP